MAICGRPPGNGSGTGHETILDRHGHQRKRIVPKRSYYEQFRPRVGGAADSHEHCRWLAHRLRLRHVSWLENDAADCHGLDGSFRSNVHGSTDSTGGGGDVAGGRGSWNVDYGIFAIRIGQRWAVFQKSWSKWRGSRLLRIPGYPCHRPCQLATPYYMLRSSLQRGSKRPISRILPTENRHISCLIARLSVVELNWAAKLKPFTNRLNNGSLGLSCEYARARNGRFQSKSLIANFR